MKQLIIFDMDGVLLDSKQNMQVAWSSVQDEIGVTIGFEDYFANIGRPFEDILRIIGVTENFHEVERVYRRASLDNMQEAPIFTGVNRALASLLEENRKLALVTSKDMTRTQVVLSHLKVDFTSVQTPGKRFRGKPAPDYLLLAMAECGVDPAESLFIGDMDTDYEAAQRAGIDYIHASWGYAENPTGNKWIANDVKDLPDVIKAIESANT